MLTGYGASVSLIHDYNSNTPHLEIANGHQGIAIATQTPIFATQRGAVEVVRLGPHLYEVKHWHQKRRNFAIAFDHMSIDESKTIVGVKVYREAAEPVSPLHYR
jgi:hypothetical protein